MSAVANEKDGNSKRKLSGEEIDALLDSLDPNYLCWSSTIAPVIIGNPDRPELAAELERLIKEKLGVGVKPAAETEASPKLKAVDGF